MGQRKLGDYHGSSDEFLDNLIGSRAAEGAEAAAAAGGKCFAAGTKVSTPNGEVNIEDIRKGGTVYAYDFDSKQVVKRKVLDTVQNFTYHWADILVGNETIHATRTHRFWVESVKQWVEAAQLKAGMAVQLADGTTKIIEAVKIRDLIKPEATYNFIVEHEHNYFVGSNEILVHNGGPDFIVTPNGQVFPVPQGATGPTPTRASGFQFNGGSGGNGLNSRVTGVRFMDPNVIKAHALFT